MMSLMPIGMPSIGERGLPSRQRAVDWSAATPRALQVEMHEGADLRLERSQVGEAAFEKIARAVGAAREARGRREVGLGRELSFSSGASIVMPPSARGYFLLSS